MDGLADTATHVLVGSVAGLQSACWGAYKDSPFEGFSVRTFVRSPLVGAAVGLAASVFFRETGRSDANLALFFGCVMTFERLAVECFKAFVRRENQEKYRIPSRFHIFGTVVEKQAHRYASGAVVLGLTVLFFAGTAAAVSNRPPPEPIDGVMWGTFAGLMIAGIGAWKDAPIEGFEALKFFRSIAVTAAWGGLFATVSDDVPAILCASMGAERMAVECHKTFVIRAVPGKFRAREPLFPSMRRRRIALIPPYLLTWITFVTLFVAP